MSRSPNEDIHMYSGECYHQHIDYMYSKATGVLRRIEQRCTSSRVLFERTKGTDELPCDICPHFWRRNEYAVRLGYFVRVRDDM